MREIVLHRRADRALDRILKNRVTQIVVALEEVAVLADVATHQNVKPLAGNLAGQYRLRIGSYRVVFELRESGEVEVLFVNFIGTRGDAH